VEKTALITGAAGGVGRALASELSADGWRLIVTSRDGERLKQAYGEQHLQVVADCSTPAGARHIFEVAKAQQRVPVALAHCVGNIRLGALHRMGEGDFMDCLNANLISAFHTLAAFVGALREARLPGAAVLVSSVAARIGTPNHEAIAAAKAGVEGLVRGAAALRAGHRRAVFIRLPDPDAAFLCPAFDDLSLRILAANAKPNFGQQVGLPLVIGGNRVSLLPENIHLHPTRELPNGSAGASCLRTHGQKGSVISDGQNQSLHHGPGKEHGQINY